MVKLRETVARLESAYARVTQESEASQQSSTGATAKYTELMSTSSRLKDENFRLKQSLHAALKTQEALERVFDDYWQTAPASPSTLVRLCVGSYAVHARLSTNDAVLTLCALGYHDPLSTMRYKT